MPTEHRRFPAAPPGPRPVRRAVPRAVAATLLCCLLLSLPAGARTRDPVAPLLRADAGAGTITQSQYAAYTAAYQAARRSLGHLSGTRAVELGAVLANVRAMAAAGTLTPSRMPAVFLTLERNRHWWTSEPLLSSGERVSFPGSRLVWQYYAGQGLEIQWLGTFGEGNGYFLSHQNAALRELLAEVLPLASQRAGGIAWEYLFRFDGGQPPWTSGLSQGTAIQLLARAWSRLHEAEYLTAARRALAIFTRRPPAGVRVDTAAGAEYAEYTFAPSDRILNGFIQALVGLYEYASTTGDPHGLSLFEAGDAEARAEVPHYDTGAWSRYDQHEESDLNYHELLTEFLEHLCERTRRGTPSGTPAPLARSPAPAPGGPGGAGPAPKPAPIPGDEIYCSTAHRFGEYLHTPPVISLLTRRLRGGVNGGVAVSLSKISTVTLVVRRAGRPVWTNTATVEAGRPRLLWPTPRRLGTYTVSLAARDLAGNFSTASGTITITRR